MSQFSQWPGNWAREVQATTQQDFCSKRVAEGMPANLCAQQYEVWRATTAGKEDKYRRGVNGGA